MILEKVSIDKYINEREDVFSRFLLSDKKSLIVAPCGSGKTYTTINILKAANQKFIFAVPNVAVKEQLEHEYKLTGTTIHSINKLLEADTRFIVCCYESLSKVRDTNRLKDYTLIYDEYHSLIADIHYRDNTPILTMLNNFKAVKFLTATPHKLINTYDEMLEIESKQKVKADIYLISQVENEKLTKTKYNLLIKKIQELKPNPTLLVISKNIELLKQITGNEVISSGNRKGDNYTSLIEGTLPNGLTVTTNLFNAGLSLYNKEEVNLIIDYSGYDVSHANYIQLINRFRQSKKVNVFVINRNNGSKKAFESSLKDWIEETVDRLNNGASLFNEKIYNQLFFNCIGYDMVDKRFIADFKNFNIIEQAINGSRNNTKEIIVDVCKSQGWTFKNELQLGEIEEMEYEKLKKDSSKNSLMGFMVYDGKVSDFGFNFLKYRTLKNKVNEEYLILNHNEQYYELKNLLSNDEKIRSTFNKRLLKNINPETYNDDIPRAVDNYFKLKSKYEYDTELTEEKKLEIKQAILELGTDTQRFSKARLLTNELVPRFNTKRTITGDKEFKDFLKFLGVKGTKKENIIYYTKNS